MSKLKYPQIIKDVADAVRTGTNTTDLIPVGQLADTILAILSRAPASGDLPGTYYTSIVYNDDDTITLIDIDGFEHTIVCEYTDGKITGATFDGVSIDLSYDNDALINVGGTDVDVSKAPTTKDENLGFNGLYGTYSNSCMCSIEI